MESQEVMEQCEKEWPDQKTSQPDSRTISGRVLIVDEHPAIRKMLVGLINEKLGVDLCFEAESIEVAYETLDSQTVDFALVDVSSNLREGTRLAELLKMRCPMLPIMAVSVKTNAPAGKDSRALISDGQAERILTAIRYMQSLVRSGLCGFTVSVKAEK
jgi:response regulator RpfG family c-di-GMP phosphodiesterase